MISKLAACLVLLCALQAQAISYDWHIYNAASVLVKETGVTRTDADGDPESRSGCTLTATPPDDHDAGDPDVAPYCTFEISVPPNITSVDFKLDIWYRTATDRSHYCTPIHEATECDEGLGDDDCTDGDTCEPSSFIFRVVSWGQIYDSMPEYVSWIDPGVYYGQVQSVATGDENVINSNSGTTPFSATVLGLFLFNPLQAGTLCSVEDCAGKRAHLKLRIDSEGTSTQAFQEDDQIEILYIAPRWNVE